MTNILFIDDDPSKMSSTLRIFEFEGYVVHYARNVKEALSEAREHQNQIDLIILDSMIGIDADIFSAEEIERSNLGMETGLILLDHLRRIKENFKVIVLSAIDRQDVRSKYVDKGVLSYLNKPYNPRVLLEEVRHILENNHTTA